VSRLSLRLLRLFFALVLCLQSGLAMAHCLRMASPAGHVAFHVEICTPEGIVTVDLGADEAPVPGDDHAGFCLTCHGAPQAALLAPPGLPLPAASLLAPPPLPRHAAAPPGARAPPDQPTGPPTRA
jgi:hypothetical protein